MQLPPASKGVDYSTGRGSGLYNACIVSRVVLTHPPTTRRSLCAPSALRGTSGGATITTPGGAGISCSTTTSSVLGAPASLIGSELPWLTGSALRFAPVLCRRVLLNTNDFPPRCG